MKLFLLRCIFPLLYIFIWYNGISWETYLLTFFIALIANIIIWNSEIEKEKYKKKFQEITSKSVFSEKTTMNIVYFTLFGCSVLWFISTPWSWYNSLRRGKE